MQLDTASSAPLHPAARDVLVAALDRGYADPRRIHAEGRAARLLLDNAREATAEALGVRPDEVTFTGSGTEAVHRGLLGLLTGRARTGDLLLHSVVEHAAVRHVAAWHTARGGLAEGWPVTRTGRLDLAALADPASAGPAAVLAVQAANHEVGTRQPVADAAERLPGVPIFVDACAAMGHEPLPERWTVAAGSAHKWGGPAGVGVLLIRKGAPWRAPSPVDDHVDPRATGFENVPGVLAAAASLQAVVAERAETNARLRPLVDRIRNGVAEIPDVEVAGDPVDRLAHLVTCSFLYVDGEALVTELDRLGFAVASGSACAATTGRPSHVLEAMGVLTHGNLRISLGRDTRAEDVERFLRVLPGVVQRVRAAGGR